MSAAVWCPSASSTTSTGNTTDWNLATTTSSYTDTWHIKITFDASISDDDFGDCGGYIP